MNYQIVMFLHVGSMFLATALAVGPSTMLLLVARSGDRAAIQRTFGYATPVFRLGGLAYGLGILFGVLTALSGAVDLTAHWLLTAYALIILLIATNLMFERWTRRVVDAARRQAVDAHEAIDTVSRERSAVLALAGMILLTLGIVFVMVVKPDILA